MKYQNKINCLYEIAKDFDLITNKEIITLVINCEKCSFFYKNREKKIFNTQCFNNLVKLFIENSDLTNTTIKTIEGNFKLTNTQINLFVDYGQQLINLYSIMKIPSLREKEDCVKKDDCENKRKFFLERIFGNKFNDGLIISNPILGYIEINQEINIYNQLMNKKLECKNCNKIFFHFLINIQSLLSQTKLIKSYLSLDNKKRKFSEIYSIIFGDYNLLTENSERNLILPKFIEKICASYKKGPYQIKIVKDLQSQDYFYLIFSIIDDPSLKKIYTKIIQQIKTKPKEYFDYEKPQKLNYLLQYEKNYVIRLIKQEYGHLSDEIISDLSELIIFDLLNLNPLMVFLIDDEIEEIFLDSPKSFIYLDQRQFGRCQTNISLTPTEIESLKTRIRIEAEQRLDEIQPFLKTEIITQYFHIRVTIQIYPLSIDGFSMSIRKLHKKILTLTDLIRNNTLSIDAAAYLLFNLIHGRCILVIGEPYSGKTTLLNSLDMIGKKYWRKIYVEDVIESIDQSSFEVHQVRFQVNPIAENSERYSNKSFQVKECLHRTPDVIFIGELIHPKSVKSFFFLLKVGLRRCLATAHGESPELIVERFIYDDQIPSPLIGNLDIIVQMNRINSGGKISRRVTRITEIKKERQIGFNERINTLPEASNLTFIDIFLRDPIKDQLVKSYNSINELYIKSDAIKKMNLLRGEYISDNDFIVEIKKIKSILGNLLETNTCELGAIIKIFHRFWQDLEINMDLNSFKNFL